MLLAARHAVLQAGENWKIEVMLKQVLCEFAFALEQDIMKFHLSGL